LLASFWCTYLFIFFSSSLVCNAFYCKYAMVNFAFTILTGKVGGFIASIPGVMVAGLLCFMWAMLTALGLSNLRYSETGSSRNIIIIGLSLFFSLSIPAYFQQYGISPNSNLSVPSYFQPYIVASHGPFQSKYGGVCLCVMFLYYCESYAWFWWYKFCDWNLLLPPSVLIYKTLLQNFVVPFCKTLFKVQDTLISLKKKRYTG